MTVQTYLQKPNKEKKHPLNVRYFHDGVFFPLGIGYSISPQDFDKKKQIVLETHPEHKLLNYKITLVKNRIMQVAQEMLLQGFDPSREVVKAAYFQSIKVQPFPILTRAAVDSLPFIEIIATPVPEKKPQPEPNHKVEKQDFITIKDVTGFEPDFVHHYYNFAELVNEWIDSSTNTTKRTKTQRRSWLKLILEFSRETKTSLSFTNFSLIFYNKYAQWLMFDSDHDLFNNSFGNNVKRLKTFLKWTELHKDITPNKQYKTFKVLTEEKQIENAYLQREEVDLLWDYQTYREHKEKSYERTIDLCIFQNLTGLRWSDVTFKGGLVAEIIKGQKVLTGKTKKSRYKQTYQIPLALDYRIELLLEKYNYNFSSVMSDVEYNRRIKEVLKEMYRKYKLHHKPYRIYRYKLDQQFTFDLYKHKMIASHSNRRGWVSWCYKELRLPEQMILRMMGSKSSQELRKYIALDTEDILNAVNLLNLTGNKAA